MAPSPPAGGVLAITCPSPIDAESSDGNPVSLTFESPRTTNGLAPVSTSCSMSAGSPFLVGSTTVSCEARDARGQLATCTFTVTVRPPPRLSYSKYLAFGDSLTEGVVSLAPTVLALDLPSSYPTVLRNLLRSRYPAQSLSVINAGVAGEFASGDGVRRFRPALLTNQPEVVLLMEGTNDLLFQQRGIEPALTALETMMADAESLNVRVCLATIPPQRGGSFPDRSVVAALIPGFNDQVRALALRRNAVLIDVFAGMRDDLSLIGRDNLHPTEHGYEVMAGIFAEGLAKAFLTRTLPSADRTAAHGGDAASRTMRSSPAIR